MKELTEDQVVEKLWQVLGLGSQRWLARKIGISPAYLNDILHGKREPGPHTLRFLGLTKRVSYVANSR